MKIDHTKSGECTGCGKCCSNLLPMSLNEVVKIFSYISEHKIKEQVVNYPLSDEMRFLTCPFLDESKKDQKCVIYEVRPLICREFICSKSALDMDAKAFFAEQHRIINLREMFFSEST